VVLGCFPGLYTCCWLADATAETAEAHKKNRDEEKSNGEKGIRVAGAPRQPSRSSSNPSNVPIDSVTFIRTRFDRSYNAINKCERECMPIQMKAVLPLACLCRLPFAAWPQLRRAAWAATTAALDWRELSLDVR
jgi:hypothetical protein